MKQNKKKVLRELWREGRGGFEIEKVAIQYLHLPAKCFFLVKREVKVGNQEKEQTSLSESKSHLALPLSLRPSYHPNVSASSDKCSSGRQNLTSAETRIKREYSTRLNVTQSPSRSILVQHRRSKHLAHQRICARNADRS